MSLPIYVYRDKASCKVWLVPVALSSSLGFSARELREIERLVSLNRAILLKAWEEFHGQPWRAGHRRCFDKRQADR
ncbi:MAG: DUF4160 domain-containing protein [Synechococcaceae cyanobacterium ELA182]